MCLTPDRLNILYLSYRLKYLNNTYRLEKQLRNLNQSP